MHKVLIVEGPRNTGKTHLLNSLGKFAPVYKFIFKDLYEFTEKSLDKTLGMSFGKDVQFLDLHKEDWLEPMIVDRRFLTSAVYGILFGRMKENEAMDYLLWVQNRFFQTNNPPEMIFIQGRNPNNRGFKDQWSNLLTYEDQLNMYERFLFEPKLKQMNKYTRMFTNGFNKESEESFLALVESIMGTIE